MVFGLTGISFVSKQTSDSVWIFKPLLGIPNANRLQLNKTLLIKSWDPSSRRWTPICWAINVTNLVFLCLTDYPSENTLQTKISSHLINLAFWKHRTRISLIRAYQRSISFIAPRVWTWIFQMQRVFFTTAGLTWITQLCWFLIPSGWLAAKTNWKGGTANVSLISVEHFPAKQVFCARLVDASAKRFEFHIQITIVCGNEMWTHLVP